MTAGAPEPGQDTRDAGRPERTAVEPYDPDSEHGRQIADELSEVLADVRLAIARRRAAHRGGSTSDAA